MSAKPSNSISVRAANAADTAFLVAGNLAMALESEGRRLDAQRLAAGVCAVLTDAQRGYYFIAEVNGVPSGQAMVTREWSDWRNGWFWWLQSVHVLPDFRRQGVFRALYQHIRAEAHAAGDVRGLRLYVEQDNAAALATYEAVGMGISAYRLCEEDWSGAT